VQDQPQLRLEAVRPVRTFEAAIDHIVEGVQRARMRPGDRLPPETALAQQLGISLPTLRQATRVLERSGFVRIRQGKGGGIFLNAELVPHDVLDRQIDIEADQVVDALRARRLLEATVTKHAMEVARPLDYDDLSRAIDLLEANLGDRLAVLRADVMFHHEIARAAHNRTLERAMRSTMRLIAPIRDSYVGGKARDEEALDVHRRQLEIMRTRNFAAIDAILDEHFRMAENAFAEATGRSWQSLFATPRDDDSYMER
jgi:GntR family transcriptional repressor for pyruvate dehydrogenase complex